ncbi:MAG TPA: TolC family protein [Vicinamibacterales bacterium]|nr:TolC family protein [Vicinamibacterales bacterium]
MDSAGSCRQMDAWWRSASQALVITAGLVCPGVAAAQSSPPAASLRELVQEAQQNNPTIAASHHAWQASTHVAAQARALPGPELTVQQFSVGSPRPFAGFSNSNFAYLGIGASQDLPYPGKRALRADVAERESLSLRAQSDAASREVIESLELAYVQLAYDEQILPLLQDNDRVLAQIQQIAASRYRVGEGNQQDVLKAQLQHTKLLQEIAAQRQGEEMLQARLKQLLNRAQDSPNIITQPLAPTPVPSSVTALLQHVDARNPDVQGRTAAVERERAQVDLAHEAFKPDFAVQYMYQHTASGFRDYYMATFSVRLPNRDRQRAVLAEAEEHQKQAIDELEAERQRVRAELQEQYVAVQGSRERLTIFREGLVPQANATFQAAMTAYAANREDFETLLSSFLDVLTTRIGYTRELADHESAVARLERLAGDVRP